MLKINHLNITQGGFCVTANWQIGAGQKVAIIGPSGAGKSTLLCAIAGFIPPSEGDILWNDISILTQPASQRPINILFQKQNIFPHLTLRQNLGFGLSNGFFQKRTHDAIISNALRRVGLGGYEGRRASTLSGGEMGRASLARCLLRARPLLLLDEPFAALGPAMRADMLMLVNEVAQETGASVLLVSHAPKEVSHFADHIIWVDDGKASAPIESAQFFKNPPLAARIYMGSTP